MKFLARKGSDSYNAVYGLCTQVLKPVVTKLRRHKRRSAYQQYTLPTLPELPETQEVNHVTELTLNGNILPRPREQTHAPPHQLTTIGTDKKTSHPKEPNKRATVQYFKAQSQNSISPLASQVLRYKPRHSAISTIEIARHKQVPVSNAGRINVDQQRQNYEVTSAFGPRSSIDNITNLIKRANLFKDHELESNPAYGRYKYLCRMRDLANAHSFERRQQQTQDPRGHRRSTRPCTIVKMGNGPHVDGSREHSRSSRFASLNSNMARSMDRTILLSEKKTLPRGAKSSILNDSQEECKTEAEQQRRKYSRPTSDKTLLQKLRAKQRKRLITRQRQELKELSDFTSNFKDSLLRPTFPLHLPNIDSALQHFPLC